MWPYKEIDLKNPKTNRKNAGFTDEERGKFTDLLAAGFVDTFRYFYPDLEGTYSLVVPTVSAPGPRMQGGALTIFVYQKALRTDW